MPNLLHLKGMLTIHSSQLKIAFILSHLPLAVQFVLEPLLPFFRALCFTLLPQLLLLDAQLGPVFLVSPHLRLKFVLGTLDLCLPCLVMLSEGLFHVLAQFCKLLFVL
jgi:hypothetical protein